MSERDDELLRRYRSLAPEAPPVSVDASILAASRRAVRPRPLARWAVPVSVAAVMVLALGLVLDMQREAPDAGMPVARDTARPPAEAGAPAAAATPSPSAAAEAMAPAAPASGATASEIATPAKPAAKKPAVRERLEKPRAPSKVEAQPAAPAVHAAQAPAQEPPPPAARSAAAPTPPTAAAATAPTLDAATRANAAPAPHAAQRALAVDPLTRELERIARLRAEGNDDEADAALVAFQREHPDYRIEPAMWDRLRRR